MLKFLKSAIWIFCILFLLFILTASQGEAADPPVDGLYALIDSGAIVTSLGGKEIHLGEKLPDTFTQSKIYSVSNANDRFDLELSKNTPFSRDVSKMALCVNSRCLTFSSISNYNNQSYIVAGNLPSRSDAEAFAGYLRTKIYYRAHPGYLIRTQFLPEKAVYAKNEPIFVKLEICNLGDKAFSFRLGGQYRYATHDNQYRFLAYGPDGAVPQVISWDMGGLGSDQELKPQDCFQSNALDLRKWLSFNKVGDYFVYGIFQLDFQDANQPTIWGDYATARFKVTLN